MFFRSKLSFLTIAGTVVGMFLGTYAVLAYAPPSEHPPGANVLPFIDVGPEYQEKAGDLWANVLGVTAGLHVGGYLQIARTTGAPPAGDCLDHNFAGRVKYDSGSKILYICR